MLDNSVGNLIYVVTFYYESCLFIYGIQSYIGADEKATKFTVRSKYGSERWLMCKEFSIVSIFESHIKKNSVVRLFVTTSITTDVRRSNFGENKGAFVISYNIFIRD